MKIMLAYYSLAGGGAERVLTTLANDFVLQNDDVSIVVLENDYQAYNLHNAIKIFAINNNNKKKGFLHRLSKVFSRIYAFRKLIRREKPEAILAFSPEVFFWIKAASIFLNVKVIGSERSNPESELKSFRGKFLIKFISRFCDGFIFLTNNCKNIYPKKTQKKSIVIPNGVFAKTIPINIPNIEDRHTNKIISVGRLIPSKDFETLIYAFSIFKKNFEDYVLNIFGDGPERNKLEKLIHELGLETSVNINCFDKNIHERMCEHSMFVFTSRSEGMPNALIEAMACGLPSISTNCNFGPNELINNRENGILVPIGDYEEIARAMEEIASNKEFAKYLSINALKIQETHSTENICKKYRKYIQSVINKNR